MPTVTAPSPLRRALRVAPPLALAGLLLGVSVAHTPARYSAGELLHLAALYLALAATLHLALGAAASLGRLPVVAAAVLVGLVAAVEVRLDAGKLAGTVRFAGAVLVLAALYAGLWRWSGGRVAAGKFRGARFARALAALAVLVALAVHGLFLTEGLRWHLLRHHQLFGRPAYHLASRPIRIERTSLWNRQPRLVAPWERAQAAVERSPAGGAGAPNVVVVLVDTLRADALAAYGGDPSWMPTVNSLAERSFVFTDMLANASWTRASVASLFTGLLPEEHGAVRFHDRLSDEWQTLAELLRAAEYRTGAFVANWVQCGKETGFDQGFDEFQELVGDVEREGRAKYARANTVIDAALEWAARPDEGEGPAFLYLHFLDPHAPYLSGDEPGAPARGIRERKRGAYRQELRYLDAELARLFLGLERELTGPTAIVLVSDHGEEFWEHGEWGHGHTLYHELVWVPALLHLPGAGAGVASEPLEVRDLFDLIALVARPDPPDVAAWARERARGTRYASQYLDRVAHVRPDKKHTAMRRVDEGAHALVWSGYGPTIELYDRASDPAELANRADRDEDTARRLRERLEACVQFWAQPPRVQRSDEALEFLQALGYAGGVRDQDTY